MAEEISMVLGNIRNLSDVGASSRVSTQLAELQSLLTQLQELTCYDIVSRHGNRVPWGLSVMCLAYFIDDLLDTFLIDIESQRRVRNRIPRVFKRFAFAYHEYVALRKLETLIKVVRNRISEFHTLHPGFIIERSWNAMNQSECRSTMLCSYNFKEHFIGRTKEIEEFVQLLTSKSEESNPTANIRGEEGSGKTSLARRIYNHIDIQRYFEAFAWVNLPKKFDEEKMCTFMWREILKQLLSYDRMKDSLMLMKEKALRMELSHVSKEMKCLIMLDTREDALDIVVYRRLYEMMNMPKTQILIITDNQRPPNFDILNGLSEDEGWELLQTKALLN